MGSRKKYKQKAAGTILLLAVPVCSTSVMAQSQLEEVIVTAQKRQERLQDVPISITAINGAQLENRGIEGVNNLNALAPNLMFRPNPGSELISTLYLRGSGTSQPAIWADPMVGMYLDGVYIGKAQGAVFDVVDLERVEVLRGPQGTLFGRNTEGGAVSLISRRPSGEWSGSVGLEVGNYNRFVERVSLDLPKMGIAKINVGYRKEDMKGWANNLTGPDLGKKDKEAYRLAATLDVTDNFKVDYTYEHNTSNNTPTVTSLYALSGWGNVSRAGVFTPNATFPVVFPGIGGSIQNAMAPYVTTSRPETVSTNGAGPLFNDSRLDGHSLVLNYKLNDNNALKYIYAIRQTRYGEGNDIDGTPLTGSVAVPAPLVVPYGTANWGLSAYYKRTTDYDQRSHEVQWIGNAGRLKYQSGLYYFKDDGVTNGAQNFSLFGPTSDNVMSSYGVGTTAKAIYGQLDYEINEKWTGTLGMRRTIETRSGWTHRYFTQWFGGPEATVLTAAQRAATFESGGYRGTFTGNSPVAAVSYKYNDTTNFYARIAKGFKSGGFSGELTNAAVQTPYKPQTSVSMEMGVKKSLWNNRAQINATVYQTKVHDLQTTQLVPGTTQSFFTNAGKVERKGVELEGTVVPVDGWKFQFGYGYLDTKIKEYLDNALNLGATRPLIDTASNREPGYAPKNTFNLSMDGRLARTQWGTLRAIVDYTYTDKMNLYVVNKSLSASNAGGQYVTGVDSLPATQNVNLRLLLAGVPLGGPGQADLSLWVRNATDEAKRIQGIDFGMFRTANWQDPRTYGLSLNYKW